LDDAQTLLVKIASALRQQEWKIAVAESVTGGRLQSLLSSQSGASDFFAGGITAYGLEQKVELLGVDQATAAATNCVSDEVSSQMAEGAIKMFGADVAIATTGYAEPFPEQQIEQPMAYVAVYAAGECVSNRIELEGDRNSVQDAVAVTALLLCWEAIKAENGA
jgi:nicotinamide-nucleotide amidase